MDIDISPAVIIPGQTWPRELRWIAEAFQRSQTHAEIGVFCGRSLYAACLGMRGATVYAIDDFSAGRSDMPDFRAPGPFWVNETLEATLQAIPPTAATVELLQQDSIDASRLLAQREVLLDSLWIDGGHSAEQLGADITAWLPLIKPKGLIAGHDYWAAHPGVMHAVQETLPRFRVVPRTRIWWAEV